MALPQLVQTGVSVSPVTISRSPIYPSVEPLILNQFVAVTDANTVQVIVVGPPLETLSRQFQQLTEQDASKIKAFFADPLVNYGQYPFTYIDYDGTSISVQWLEPQLVLPRESSGNIVWEPVFTKV